MATEWVIKAGSERFPLNDQNRGEITFTVTNQGQAADRAVLEPVPGDGADRSWFTVEEPQRLVPGGGSTTYLMSAKMPPGTPPGAYWVQGRVYSADTAPEESSRVSDRVAFETRQVVPAKKRQWWPYAVAAALAVVVLVVVAVLVFGGDDTSDAGGATTTTVPSPGTSPPPTPTGPDVTNLTVANARSDVVLPGRSLNAVANCPAGTEVIGGGYFRRSTTGIVVDFSGPVSTGQGWQVDGFNPTTANFDFDVEAVCGTVRDYQVVTGSPVALQPGQEADAVVACPAGKVSTGGGGQALGLVIDASRPAGSGQGWQIRVRNTASGIRTIFAFAVCATAPSLTVATTSFTVQPGTRFEGGVDCPAGKVGTGGGYVAPTGAGIDVFISAPSSTGWDVRADNRTGAAQTVTAQVVCASSG